jgi:hypothetical protein
MPPLKLRHPSYLNTFRCFVSRSVITLISYRYHMNIVCSTRILDHSRSSLFNGYHSDVDVTYDLQMLSVLHATLDSSLVKFCMHTRPIPKINYREHVITNRITFALLLRRDRLFPLVEINHLVVYASMVNPKVGRTGKNISLKITLEQMVNAITTLDDRMKQFGVEAWRLSVQSD